MWLDIEVEFQERYPFHPIAEVTNNHKSSLVLLSPVPQLNLPCNAPTPNYFQSNMKEVVDAVKQKVEPVAYSLICAIMESVRLAQHFIIKGDILASRTPDLNIQFNCIAKSRCWEKQPEKEK